MMQKTYYDYLAPGYSDLHREEQRNKVRIIADNLTIKHTDLLLDIGCGPYFGDFKCTVIGLDPSIQLLSQARIPIVCGRAEALPFRNHSVDIIISVTALQNFDDPELALREAWRVGRGRFAFTFLRKSAKAPILEGLVRKYFQVSLRIEEVHDIILLAKYKKEQGIAMADGYQD